jgi:thymidylate synthase (FAD)
MKIEVLDHGYVELIESWGLGSGSPLNDDDTKFLSDCERGIIEAARQSTQGSFRGWDQDERLLRHLYEHRHLTPFEFAGMVVEVQAPIFVFREWHRHRTQSYNEMSARYAPLPDLYYLPDQAATQQRVHAAAISKNKQEQSVAKSSDETVLWLQQVEAFYRIAEALYQNALEKGIPKELARVVMPVGHYSRMRASTTLRNWLAFLTLRMDPAAQWEIRQYAGAVAVLMRQVFPHTMSLFEEKT